MDLEAFWGLLARALDASGNFTQPVLSEEGQRGFGMISVLKGPLYCLKKKSTRACRTAHLQL